MRPELEKHSWHFHSIKRRNNSHQVLAWMPKMGKVVSLQKFIVGEAQSKLKVTFREHGTDFRKNNLYVSGRFYNVRPAPRKGKGVVSAMLFSRTFGEIKTYLDKKNLDALSKHQWSIAPNTRSKDKNAIYFCDTVDRSIRLHRMVCELNPTMICFEGGVTDHVDGDPLNNTEANLHWVTRQENKWNYPKHKGSIGVQKTPSGKWIARIGFGKGKHKHLGTFDTKAEAQRARDMAVVKYREIINAERQLNFPERLEEYLAEVNNANP
jgi:hypothetical protein